MYVYVSCTSGYRGSIYYICIVFVYQSAVALYEHILVM